MARAAARLWDGDVTTLALVLGIVAEAVLVAGGTIGGSLAYVYGVRVLNNPNVPVADALIPGRASPSPAPDRPAPRGLSSTDLR